MTEAQYDWAMRVLDAIETLLTEGNVMTPDLGGTASTRDVGSEIMRLLSRRQPQRYGIEQQQKTGKPGNLIHQSAKLAGFSFLVPGN